MTKLFSGKDNIELWEKIQKIKWTNSQNVIFKQVVCDAIHTLAKRCQALENLTCAQPMSDQSVHVQSTDKVPESIRETEKILGIEKIPGIEKIQTVVCKYFDIDMDTLKSRSRRKFVEHPRSLAIYLCRKLTNETLKSISKVFNRSLPTIQYQSEKVKSKIKYDNKMRQEIEFLSEKIREGENL